METTKRCSKCGEEKPLDQFQIRSDTGKIRGQCVPCKAEIESARYQKWVSEGMPKRPKPPKQTPEEKAAQRRAYYQANKEKHRDKVSECARRRREQNPELIREKQRKWYYANQEKHLEWLRAYSRTEPRRKYAREKIAKREAEDIGYRIQKRLRNRVSILMREAIENKAAPSMEMLGCTVSELLVHLESQFYDGMTWDHYGKGRDKFQIDHIKPCCSFDLTDPQQQLQCFHYTNLQPLWHKDHAIKSAEDMRNCRKAA